MAQRADSAWNTQADRGLLLRGGSHLYGLRQGKRQIKTTLGIPRTTDKYQCLTVCPEDWRAS